MLGEVPSRRRRVTPSPPPPYELDVNMFSATFAHKATRANAAMPLFMCGVVMLYCVLSMGVIALVLLGGWSSCDCRRN